MRAEVHRSTVADPLSFLDDADVIDKLPSDDDELIQQAENLGQILNLSFLNLLSLANPLVNDLKIKIF